MRNSLRIAAAFLLAISIVASAQGASITIALTIPAVSGVIVSSDEANVPFTAPWITFTAVADTSQLRSYSDGLSLNVPITVSVLGVGEAYIPVDVEGAHAFVTTDRGFIHFTWLVISPYVFQGAYAIDSGLMDFAFTQSHGPAQVSATTFNSLPTAGRVNFRLLDGRSVYVTAASNAATLTIAVGSVVTANVIEYYNASLDHYFMTWIPDEVAKLDTGVQIPGWSRTGYSFSAYTSEQAGTTPVCRFYIPPEFGDSHFFGRDRAECLQTRQKFPTFTLEDSASMHLVVPFSGGLCPQGAAPIYRVFSNRADANHRYTTSSAVRDQMVAEGWLAEGDGSDRVVMCAPS